MPKPPTKYPGGKGRPATSGTRYGNGSGHGGPAKGMPAERKAAIHNPETAATQNLSGKPGYHAMTKAQRLQELAELLWQKARLAERDNDQIAAIRELWNREEGAPIARQVSLTKDEYDQLSDSDLAAEQARVDAALAEIAPGTTEAGGPSGPDGVVH